MVRVGEDNHAHWVVLISKRKVKYLQNSSRKKGAENAEGVGEKTMKRKENESGKWFVQKMKYEGRSSHLIRQLKFSMFFGICKNGEEWKGKTPSSRSIWTKECINVHEKAQYDLGYELLTDYSPYILTGRIPVSIAVILWARVQIYQTYKDQNYHFFRNSSCDAN